MKLWFDWLNFTWKRTTGNAKFIILHEMTKISLKLALFYEYQKLIQIGMWITFLRRLTRGLRWWLASLAKWAKGFRTQIISINWITKVVFSLILLYFQWNGIKCAKNQSIRKGRVFFKLFMGSASLGHILVENRKERQKYSHRLHNFHWWI